MSRYISEAVIRRLPIYYRHLRDLEQAGVQQISSQELGEQMQLTPSQIRQDINSFGGAGRQGYGYQVHELREHIQGVLGLNREHRMVILGAGRMGQAVANYAIFAKEGFRTLALFDSDARKVRRKEGTIPIYPVEELPERVPELKADIAVLAVPASEAQHLLDQVYGLGIRAIWNFAPLDLSYPEDMAVVNVHLSDTLGILSYLMSQQEG